MIFSTLRRRRFWGECRESNARPPESQSSALANWASLAMNSRAQKSFEQFALRNHLVFTSADANEAIEQFEEVLLHDPGDFFNGRIETDGDRAIRRNNVCGRRVDQEDFGALLDASAAWNMRDGNHPSACWCWRRPRTFSSARICGMSVDTTRPLVERAIASVTALSGSPV